MLLYKYFSMLPNTCQESLSAGTKSAHNSHTKISVKRKDKKIKFGFERSFVTIYTKRKDYHLSQ